MLKYSCDSEITNLDLATLSHEYILGLKVTMQDLSVMDVLDCQGHLDEPV